MLWIILGIGLAVALFFWLPDSWPIPICVALVVLAVAGGIIAPVLFDLGYNEKQLESQVELVTLGTDVTSVGSGNRRYVTISGKKVYTYRYEVENTTDFEGTMYETTTVSGNVQEIESEECETPTLYIYLEKTKNSWWFSAHIEDRYTYVFYVPEGTIVRDVTLD